MSLKTSKYQIVVVSSQRMRDIGTLTPYQSKVILSAKCVWPNVPTET